MNKKKQTREQLEQRIKDLEAQLPSTYRSAKNAMNKAGDALTASAAVITISAFGGRTIVQPVAILDGLSKETIECIKNDIQRSLDYVTRK